MTIIEHRYHRRRPVSSRVNGAATGTAHNSECNAARWSASRPSVTVISARPATSSRNTLALSRWIATSVMRAIRIALIRTDQALEFVEFRLPSLRKWQLLTVRQRHLEDVERVPDQRVVADDADDLDETALAER